MANSVVINGVRNRDTAWSRRKKGRASRGKTKYASFLENLSSFDLNENKTIASNGTGNTWEKVLKSLEKDRWLVGRCGH
jgi:hypothetical protein